MAKDELATIVRDRQGKPEHAVIRWEDYLTLLRIAAGELAGGDDDTTHADLQRIRRAASDALESTAPKADLDDEEAEDIALAERGEAAARLERQMVAHASERLGVEIELGIPHEVLKRELEGVHPVRAWREYRGLNQAQLAADAEMSRAYLTQIETGARSGTLDLMVKLARNLRCMVEDLIPDADDEEASKD